MLKPLLFIAEFCRRNKKKGLNMKVITMESSVFRSLTEQIAEIAAHVRAVSGDKRSGIADRLLTTREAAHLLNVSTRTLQRMRSEQRIGYVVLRGKCRYRQSEIDRLLDESTVNEDAATPQELKRNHTLRTGGNPKEGGHRSWNCSHETTSKAGCRSDGTARPSGRTAAGDEG